MLDLPGAAADRRRAHRCPAACPLGEVRRRSSRASGSSGSRPLAADAPTLALGTAQGIVKRVAPGDVPGNRDAWEVIALKDGDEVVGAAAVADDDELVLVASDASLLHFAGVGGPAAGPRRGRHGRASSSPPAQRVVAFGAVPADGAPSAVVVTVAGASGALPGTQAGSAKVTPFEAVPGQGPRDRRRARAPVPAQGEDALLLAWVGAGAGAGDRVGRSADRAARARPASRRLGHAAGRAGARHRLTRQTSATTLSGTGGRCATCGPAAARAPDARRRCAPTTAAASRPCPTA